MELLYVLYDKDCGLCRSCKRWLENQPKYINMGFIAQQSNQLPKMMPELIDDLKLEELVLVTEVVLIQQFLALVAKRGKYVARAVVHQVNIHRKSISEAMRWAKNNDESCDGPCAI